jgi:ClpP class serine protease
MIPNVSGLAGKIGVSPQFVSTNPEVDFPSLFRPMTESQMALMQGYINRGYDKFVGRVAKGRNLSDARVRQIAEGRVWDGAKALELKLVDQLGQLDDAIDWVQAQVDKKGGKKCDVAFYPEIDSNFWSLVQMSLQNEMRASLIEEATKLVPDAEAADELTRILSRKPVQARMMPMKVTLQ